MLFPLVCFLFGLVLASGPASGTGTRAVPRLIQLPNGKTVPNPEYKKKPVISNLKQLEDYKNTENGKDIALDEETQQSLQWFQEELEDADVDPTEREDEVAKVFQKFEIPIGLLNKCMGLETFNAIEFIIDDSYSMLSGSKSHGTRWNEAFARIDEMLEVALHFLVPAIHFRFLNDPVVPVLERRQGEKSSVFVERARLFLENLKKKNAPCKGKLTPLLQAISTSLASHSGSLVARFIFADGHPDRKKHDIDIIKKLLVDRADPQKNPITMFSVSDRPESTAWMRELDEAAPFCDEKSLFEKEILEIESNQGDGFPYTYGFHIVSCLVGANNPFDLDALDETVPLLKKSFFTLIGVVEQKRYDLYWNGFIEAQQNCPGTNNADKLRKEMNWQQHRHLFEHANGYDEISIVGAYKDRLQRLLK